MRCRREVVDVGLIEARLLLLLEAEARKPGNLLPSASSAGTMSGPMASKVLSRAIDSTSPPVAEPHPCAR